MLLLIAFSAIHNPFGLLADDFRISESERTVQVLNAPSPAATASLSIGRTIANLALKKTITCRGITCLFHLLVS